MIHLAEPRAHRACLGILLASTLSSSPSPSLILRPRLAFRLYLYLHPLLFRRWQHTLRSSTRRARACHSIPSRLRLETPADGGAVARRRAQPLATFSGGKLALAQLEGTLSRAHTRRLLVKRHAHHGRLASLRQDGVAVLLALLEPAGSQAARQHPREQAAREHVLLTGSRGVGVGVGVGVGSSGGGWHCCWLSVTVRFGTELGELLASERGVGRFSDAESPGGGARVLDVAQLPEPRRDPFRSRFRSGFGVRLPLDAFLGCHVLGPVLDQPSSKLSRQESATAERGPHTPAVLTKQIAQGTQ
eukprot:scaffold87647_cov58-Phaeocystis_antarctica.AAC.2